MTKKNLLLLFLPLLFACKSDENLKLVYSESNSIYQTTIATIDTKINEYGKAQCSNYAKISSSVKSYKSYGKRIRDVLAASHNTLAKYIGKLPFDSLENKYLDVRIDNHTENKLNLDSLLLLGISTAFNIKATPIDSLISGYELVVKDFEQLQAYQSDCGNGKTSHTRETWKATSSKLTGVIEVMNEYTNSFINLKAPNQNCYSVEFFVGKDINKVNDGLKPYGLMLEEKEFIQTFYKINSVDNTSL